VRLSSAIIEQMDILATLVHDSLPHPLLGCPLLLISRVVRQAKFVAIVSLRLVFGSLRWNAGSSLVLQVLVLENRGYRVRCMFERFVVQ